MRDIFSKIKKLPELKRIIRRRQRRGERIVFTNGCFDLLHRGHIELLRSARRLGDVLVVGLNSDSSVRRLKGKERPLQSLGDRSYILAALEAVDYVVIFSEDTPARLIARIRPDVLVKGADYAKDEIVGAKCARFVRRLRLVSGRSTSALIRKIVRRYER